MIAVDVVAEVVRSGLVESRHRGVVVHVDAGGAVDWAIGDPETVVYPRSSNKPFQAMGMLAAGLDLDGPELAIATSSHSGERRHVDLVRGVLARAGLDESALQSPEAYPMDAHEHARVLREGGARARVLMDCSGKHAAMLLTCVTRGWSTEDYLDPQHPLQQQITATFAELTEAAPPVVSTDGCGAPLLATTMHRLALATGRVARGDTPTSARLVAAITAHPEVVSGARRDERHFITRLPGAIAKSGAESVLVVGLPDGSAFAAKIEDGGERPLYAVMSRAVEVLGVEVSGGGPVLPEPRPPVLGGGRPIGEVRPAF